MRPKKRRKKGMISVTLEFYVFTSVMCVVNTPRGGWVRGLVCGIR